MKLTVGIFTFFVAWAAPSGTLWADDLDRDATWSELTNDELSFVFGRIQGRFDGTDYRGRKIRIRNEETGKEHTIDVDKGLGYFEAALPVGTYTFLSIEAVYFPPVKSLRLNRFRPVPQRYVLQEIPNIGVPTFPVVRDRPLYLGTIRSGVGGDSLVYGGHALEIVDEFEKAFTRLESSRSVLFDSLTEAGVEPSSYFFLTPVDEEEPLELANVDDPLNQARDYMEDAKYEQALSWLQTFMPTTDAEREEMRLLVGEIYLSDKKYEDAIEELGDVLLDEPENMRALRLLARAHAFSGNREDALGLYRALAESVPDDAEASLHLGYDYALAADPLRADAAFESAFRVNFDYLLHDLTPYAMALKVENAEYEPPKIIDGAVRMPKSMRSRRGTQGAFGMLLDHDGRIVAVHVSANAGQWVPAMMMTIIRARFQPARLNGVAIPCLIIVGAGTELEAAQ
jgi:tetratricopeptide (TPR) repeat protein